MRAIQIITTFFHRLLFPLTWKTLPTHWNNIADTRFLLQGMGTGSPEHHASKCRFRPSVGPNLFWYTPRQLMVALCLVLSLRCTQNGLRLQDRPSNPKDNLDRRLRCRRQCVSRIFGPCWGSLVSSVYILFTFTICLVERKSSFYSWKFRWESWATLRGKFF